MTISVLQIGKLRLRVVSCLKVTPLVELIITPDSLVPEPKLYYFLMFVCLFISLCILAMLCGVRDGSLTRD